GRELVGDLRRSRTGVDADAGEVAAEEHPHLRERADVETLGLVELRAHPHLLRHQPAVHPVAALRGLEDAEQRAELSVRGLVEDAAGLVGALPDLARDLLALPHPLVGGLETALEHLRFLAHEAGRAADLAGKSGELAE